MKRNNYSERSGDYVRNLSPDPLDPKSTIVLGFPGSSIGNPTRLCGPSLGIKWAFPLDRPSYLIIRRCHGFAWPWPSGIGAGFSFGHCLLAIAWSRCAKPSQRQVTWASPEFPTVLLGNLGNRVLPLFRQCWSDLFGLPDFMF